jgi:hypothetical protein
VVIAESYPDGLPPTVRTDAHFLLEGHALRLAHDQSADDWQPWNLSRERISDLLSREGLLR